MVVKSYFDGSVVANKSITLASIAADEVTWRITVGLFRKPVGARS
jgi:hypothetical protein